MWTRKLLKENAKIAFKRNYWLCVAVSLIAMILGAGSSGGWSTSSSDASDDSYYSEDYYYEEDYYYDDMSEVEEIILEVLTSPIFIITVVIISVVVLLLGILVSNIVNVGHKRFYLENREHKTKISQIFYSFCEGRYGNAVWIMFCKGLYLFGWSLLFIIPGIIKSFSYMMIPYILADNPEISKERAFEISRGMMRGRKWDAFVLGLSFFGWQLLSGITLGLVGIFWVNPYMDATYAEFYSALKAEAFQNGITDVVELPGFGYPNFAEQQFADQDFFAQ